VTKTKTKKRTVEQEYEETESLPVVIPELRYLTAKYIVRVPAGDRHFQSRWELRKYAEQLVEAKLGDEVQLTSMKVRKPHLLAKTKARLLKQEPSARLLVTVKF
jgi:hypothetical protein